MPSNSTSTFGAESPVTFTVMVTNNGSVTESYVPQVYPLQRVSHISQPVKQLVAFMRVYLDLGESRVFSMKPEVERYLKILNRRYEWEVEKGEYTITLLANGGIVTDTGVNVTMRCGLGELASTR
ncbi:hypothetical protein DOTSEDRAFT_74901 [Dothistroma septosporum NZE10]|uniref:Fibronectin type III-like domain-containing protein n=1 Tax=Dothistroma septosporum (strain NZE10 / CBS 128990) TaxID=675120 RepID=N1PD51_DOTSN|nr:hypothetical protein DOTSEDRAFT_74901 [Dothistroma septosporum NZE10]